MPAKPFQSMRLLQLLKSRRPAEIISHIEAAALLTKKHYSAKNAKKYMRGRKHLLLHHYPILKGRIHTVRGRGLYFW